jgi:hypothetical protein
MLGSDRHLKVQYVVKTREYHKSLKVIAYESTVDVESN